MTSSPVAALLWEIWRRHRDLCIALLAATAVGRTLQALDSAPVAGVLRMLSFVLLFGIFNYTEPAGGRGLGRFPPRLFVLPVSSLKLAAVPVLAGVIAIVLLYLTWLDPRGAGGFTSVLFTSVLLGTLMVCCQAAIWTLDRLGPLRLVVVASLVVGAFVMYVLPGEVQQPASWWLTKGGLTALMTAASMLVFAGVWRHLSWVRSGASHRAFRMRAVVPRMTRRVRRRAFRSPAAAQFWFEWRSSGFMLPLLTAGVILAILGPLSWANRHDAGETRDLLIAVLAVPVFLAIPLGAGIAKPVLWSEDLSIPAFTAVRPLSDADLVATKVRVAMASTVVSWLVVLAFAGVWLPLWGNVEALRAMTGRLSEIYGRSIPALSGLAGVSIIAAMFLTWRFLVSRLWSGLSGRRSFYVASAGTLAVLVMAGIAFDASRLPGWILQDSSHLTGVLWAMAALVATKYALAAYGWRRIAPSYRRDYLLVWLTGTASVAVAGFMLLSVARPLAPDVSQLPVLIILAALLAVPIARPALACLLLERNRHR